MSISNDIRDAMIIKLQREALSAQGPLHLATSKDIVLTLTFLYRNLPRFTYNSDFNIRETVSGNPKTNRCLSPKLC